jgi:hypothetical protein
MKMLLKQALYEIGQLLPQEENASQEQKTQYTVKALLRPNRDGGRATDGYSRGSIGSYEFSFIHCSREFKELEDQLFEQGYEANHPTLIGVDGFIYTHTTLPAKVIEGRPLSIVDAPEHILKGLPF